MFTKFIEKKSKGIELTQTDYYEAIDKFLACGVYKDSMKFFIALNSFGMSKKEVLSLTKALRDSGEVFSFDDTVLEKHSTGGIGDSTSVVLVPLLASLGYKIIKTTAKSFVFTNGSADRFGAIPNFKCSLTHNEVEEVMRKTNACVLSHDGEFCPADKLLYDVREKCGIADDINLLASSIASKKLASGAKVILVDIKYGYSSIVKTIKDAKKLAKLLKYIFDKYKVKSIFVITSTSQTIGEGIGNAVEVVDALKVLQGRKCLLRDISVSFATEMILKVSPKLRREDVVDMVSMALDNGTAYKKFMDIVKAQGGDSKVLESSKLFIPYNSVNFKADRDGFVGSINSLVLGELVRRICAESHDRNLGVVQRVKIGDYVRAGDIIVSFYYKDKEDLEKYKNAIAGCIRVTEEKIEPVKVIKKVIV